MDKILKEKLIKIAREKQTKNDPSHDFQHIFRVFNLALQIGNKENADMDILIPAALFHDIIVYKKIIQAVRTRRMKALNLPKEL